MTRSYMSPVRLSGKIKEKPFWELVLGGDCIKIDLW